MSTLIHRSTAAGICRFSIGFAAAFLAVVLVSGTLVVESLVQGRSQPFRLTTPVSIQRPAGHGPLSTTHKTTSLSATQVADRYAVRTGNLERTDNGPIASTSGRPEAAVHGFLP